MPDWKAHLIFGCLLAVFWFNLFYFGGFLQDTLKTGFLLVLSLFSTIFADVDEKHSKIRGFLSLGTSFLISLTYITIYRSTWYYGIIYFMLLLALFKVMPSKHRGFTHSVKFAILFSALMAVFFIFALNLGYADGALWFSIIFLSYGMHLLLDSL
jgi:membrane-bound metal-dependent hydrolase YbcI (DUF457 family)